MSVFTRKEKAGAICVWIACAIFNWGAIIGDMCGTFPQSEAREYFGVAGFFASIGPIGTVASIFATNFYQYGFRWK